MAINAEQRQEILGIADGLRAILGRMNAIDQYGNGDIRQISSKGYGHVDHGLSDCLAVLTEGRGDQDLVSWLLDNPDESTEWCIGQWEESILPWEYIQYREQARLRNGERVSIFVNGFEAWMRYQESRVEWAE